LLQGYLGRAGPRRQEKPAARDGPRRRLRRVSQTLLRLVDRAADFGELAADAGAKRRQGADEEDGD
jgi:hypothetical protein